MAIATIDDHSRTNGFLSAAAELVTGDGGSTLIYRIESQVRDVIPTAMGRDGALVVEGTDARVMAGSLAGGRFRGLERVMFRADGSAVIEGREDIDIGDAHVAVDLRGSVHAATWTCLPSPDTIAAAGSDFPDEDLRITGSALIRTASPRLAHLDGTIARIEGWVNFASGELEIEARAADHASA